MGARTFSYLLEDALTSIRSAKLLNLIAVTTIAISMFIFSIFLWSVANLDSFAARISRDAQLTVYLMDDSTEEQRLSLLTALQKRKEVQSVDFLSKDQALEEFRKSLKGQEAILQGLSQNPLPSSFEVRFRAGYRTAADIGGMAGEVVKMAGVESVEYGKDWLDNFARFLASLRLLSILMGVGLALSVTFIVANTVRLTAYTRSEEVEIMKLIGATDSFIKWPFMIEGGLQGGIGAALALAANYGVHHALTLFLSSAQFPLLQGIVLNFLPLSYIVAFLAGGVFLGLAGSFLSVRTFFKAE
ncbi:MAG: ABC transporter permease [Nitrospirota bacterium]|nr:ABC transporter permease [Nitrospirota bacterium]